MTIFKLTIGNKILMPVKIFFLIIMCVVILFGHYYQRQEFNDRIDETLVYQADKVMLSTKLLNEIAASFAQIIASDELILSTLSTPKQLRDSLNKIGKLNRKIDGWIEKQKRHSDLVPDFSIFDNSGELLYGEKKVDKVEFTKTFFYINNGERDLNSGIYIKNNRVYFSAVASIVNRRGKRMGTVLTSFDLNTINQIGLISENVSFAVFCNNSDNEKPKEYIQQGAFTKGSEEEFYIEQQNLLTQSYQNDKYKFMFNKIDVLNLNTDGVYVFRIDTEYMQSKINKIRLIMLIVIFVLMGVTFLFIYSLIKRVVSSPVQQVAAVLENLSKGKVAKNLPVKSADEIGQIRQAINKLNTTFATMIEFARQIGAGNLDAQFTPKSEEDALGKALLNMRQNLLDAKLVQEKHRQEEKIRKWASDGHIEFASLMRKKYGATDEFADAVLQNLIKYLNLVVGAIYIYDRNKEFLLLTSSKAYEDDTSNKQAIEVGEGLVGTCAADGETIFIKDVPHSYLKIVSGLGETKPMRLLLVALKQNEEVLGVLELASFYEIEKYQIEFVENLAASIAVTLKMMYLYY